MHNRCAATLRCCKNCKPLFEDEFKQVVNLKKSGLLIYIHNNDLLHKKNFDRTKESVILCNSSNRELKRFDYVGELCKSVYKKYSYLDLLKIKLCAYPNSGLFLGQYKTKCIKCRALIQRIRNLIDNITVINKNEMLGVCDYCKRLPTRNKCKRCEYYMHKFVNNETQRYLESEKNFHEWLCNIRRFLLSVMQGQIVCKHNIYLDSESKIQLDELLKQINWPKQQRRLSVDFLCDFSDNLRLENSFLSSNLIEKTDLENIRDSQLINDKLSSESSASTNTCICKYLCKKATIEKNERMKDSLSNMLLETKKVEEVKPDESLKKKQQLPKISNVTRKLKPKKKKDIEDKEEEIIKKKVEKQTQIPDSDYELMLKMIKQRQDLKHRMKNILQPEKNIEYPKIELPVIDLLKKKNEITSTTISQSESVVECESDESSNVNEMIKGNKIVPYQRPKPIPVIKKIPILFQIEHSLSLPTIDSNKSIISSNAPEKDTKDDDNKAIRKSPGKDNSGIIRYQLSKREFIDRGWTKLPTIKIMRRMNIYNMVPSYPKFDWFKNHKNDKMLFYESSEKLAEIHKDGCGKWFYKNGKMALDYYSAADLSLGKRCVIYSSGEEIDAQNKKSLNVIASFDYLGNGVVYDNKGKVRLQYNQSEGFVIDGKIGPPCRWMWHTLNEPPDLFPIFCDTFVTNKPYLKVEKENDEMIAIELEKIRREKVVKTHQAYTPFEIKMKVVKINDYFSLRIINQSKIYIQFRCEHICLKIDVGMLLKHKDLIKTDFAEVSEMPIDTCDFQKNI